MYHLCSWNAKPTKDRELFRHLGVWISTVSASLVAKHGQNHVALHANSGQLPTVLKNGGRETKDGAKVFLEKDQQWADMLSQSRVYTDVYAGSPGYFQFPNRSISKWNLKIYFIRMTNVSPLSLHLVTPLWSHRLNSLKEVVNLLPKLQAHGTRHGEYYSELLSRWHFQWKYGQWHRK